MRMHWISGVGKVGQLREPKTYRTMALAVNPPETVGECCPLRRFTSVRDSLTTSAAPVPPSTLLRVLSTKKHFEPFEESGPVLEVLNCFSGIAPRLSVG